MNLRTLVFAASAAAVVFSAGAAAQPADERIASEAGPLRVETFARGLEHPWGAAFLPDGRLLVTERPGRLRMVSAQGEVSTPIAGVPEVYARGQGGLLDVALDPDFGRTRLIYLSYAEPGEGGASTAVARGRLDERGTRLEDVSVIFRQMPKVSGGNHFGSRLAFSRDGHLFVTLGERFKFEPAQDLSGHLGAIVRIAPDGAIPQDNPFVGKAGARPEIWSYGHRNVQGAAIHPATGELWTHEFGPRGGDELNVPEAGRNYGWPVVSWGRHYSGADIPDPPTRTEFAPPVYYWNPAISPSGMIFYGGAKFPAWRGDILIGGLSSEALIRVKTRGRVVTAEERISLGVRIRDVVEGPDGDVYLLTDEDEGRILRLSPAGAR